MTSLDKFKLFIKNNPTLVNYVKDGTKSWQDFYELYDLYGEDKKIWDEYLNKEKTSVSKSTKNSINIDNILEYAKNIDMNKLEEGITSIQKAISLFSGMLVKDEDNQNNYTPRPVYQRFDD